MMQEERAQLRCNARLIQQRSVAAVVILDLPKPHACCLTGDWPVLHCPTRRLFWPSMRKSKPARLLAAYQACFSDTKGLSGKSAAYLVCSFHKKLCLCHWGCRRATLWGEYRGWRFRTAGLRKGDVGLDRVGRRPAWRNWCTSFVRGLANLNEHMRSAQARKRLETNRGCCDP